MDSGIVHIFSRGGEVTPSAAAAKPAKTRRSPPGRARSPLSSSISSPACSSQFSRVPFSWEKHPGIPKKQAVKKNEAGKPLPAAAALLPPPPNSSCGHHQLAPGKEFRPTSFEAFRGDPFFAALMECSEDGRGAAPGNRRVWKAAVPRTSTDLFRMFLNFHGSCKNACDVSESTTVYLPRQDSNTGTVVCRRRR